MDNTHTKAIGVLELGAKVNILKKKAQWFKIRIVGWQQKGLASVVYAFNGVRIIKVELTTNGEKFTNVLKTVKDKDTGLVWKKVELKSVWINSKNLSKNMDKVWKSTSSLFHNRCSMCHALPKSTKFTANQWPATLRVMAKRAALDRSQNDEVSKFLQYHAKDTIKFAK
jgi:trimethylamine-N-oxide reductase cytochrome c-type subunit TorC